MSTSLPTLEPPEERPHITSFKRLACFRISAELRKRRRKRRIFFLADRMPSFSEMPDSDEIEALKVSAAQEMSDMMNELLASLRSR